MPDDQDLFKRLINRLGLPAETSRRGFILSTLGVPGAAAALAWAQKPSPAPFVILENAEGVLVTDTTRCVGCRRS